MMSIVFVFLKGRAGNVDAGSGKGPSAPKLYLEATALKNERELWKAKEKYQEIMMNHPNFDQMEKVEKELESVNMEILLSNTVTPKTVIYEIQSGDSLAKIAKKYNTTIEFIKKSNHLQSDIIRVGQKLRIWTGTFNIFVDKSQNVLMLKDGDEVLKVYKVSTGENNSTPVGQFKIIDKLEDPVWFNKGIAVPPDSPQNVLGSRWLGFDLSGYGIHGTVDPDKIGQQVTAGCVRMRNSDVEEIYSLVPEGTQVTIVD